VNPGRVAGAVGAVLAPLDVQRDEEHGEIKRVTYARVPLFWRDERGRPRVFGIPFPRWVRGERK
jgi:hypothetical protein